MNKYIINTITGLLFFSISIVSCEEIVNPEILISKTNKLVVNSFISPQFDVIEVEVSRSRPVLGRMSNIEDHSDIVTNAMVIISDGNEKMELEYNSYLRTYRIATSDFPIVEGKRYELTVSHENETAKASCTVPKTIDVKNVSITDSYSGGGYTLNIEWTNAFANYFHVRYAYSADSISEHGKDRFIISRPSIKPSIQEYVEIAPPVEDRRVRLLLLSADENYYTYQKQLLTNSSDGDNPFIEPEIIYTNIDGGLGIFGAYSALNINIILK